MQRSDILQAAAQAFRQKGYHAASMQDIADAVQLHRSLEPKTRAQHIKRRDHYEQIWRNLIKEGVEANIFQPVDEAVATFALLGVQNWMITWFKLGGPLTAQQLADRFCDLFLHGLLTTEGRAK